MKRLYFILFLLLCTYVYFGWVTLDPDFGWRIKVGQLILKQGIPRVDPFSFTMMKYPFVDHEWFTHISIAFTHSVTENRIWLSLLFGVIAVLSLYKAISTINKKHKNDWFVSAIIFLIGSSILSTVGIRPQVWGWFIFVLWINELRKGTKSSIFILCLLQLVWVNTHGSFFLGGATYVIYIFSQIIQKKEITNYIGKLVIILCVTLINPYGWRMWWEVWMQLTDYQLRWRIQEWLPGILVLNVGFWVYSVIFFSLLVKYGKQISLFEKLLSLIFFLSALSSVRNIPLFLLVSVTSCIHMWFLLKNSVIQEMKRHFLLIKYTLIILFFFIGLFRVGNGIRQIKSINEAYPVNATDFLIRKKAQGKVFTEYDWGGYIIWKTSLRVFIDGRMPSWRWNQNDPKQSNNITEEYFYIASKHPPFEPYRKKYNITYALIKKGEKKNIFSKYKIVYEDNLSVIYKL